MTCFICNKNLNCVDGDINIVDVYNIMPINSIKIVICSECYRNYGGLTLRTYNPAKLMKEDDTVDDGLRNLKMKLIDYSGRTIVGDVVINTGTMRLERRE